ncbi:hypothetical protein X768_16610 [Mesorhizobium sp. LSJC265A00]|uniref:hypothetical protein n=1 Tax=Mesorhizobium sp. LSJC265A00 TaxID=1287322 RepID=UPI0003CED405|nr:hypothetical protein [Mesorhizobium sp. LSJC265A00]ESX09969.1 hypothetical protein X768_16610 [Mesorhizobium sp. LSJC265A00]
MMRINPKPKGISKTKSTLKAGTARSLSPNKEKPKPSRSLHEAPLETPSAADGLRTVRQTMNSLEGQHIKRVSEQLAHVYRHALLLREDEDEWMAFCREAEWEEFPGKPGVDKQPEALRFAVRFAVGFPTEKDQKRAATKRVSKFAAVLKVLQDDDVKPDDVVRKLQEVGIEELSAEAARRNKAPAAPTVWTLRFPDENSAKYLASMSAGKFVYVKLRLTSVDGLLAEAIVREQFAKLQKKVAR